MVKKLVFDHQGIKPHPHNWAVLKPIAVPCPVARKILTVRPRGAHPQPFRQ